MWKQIRLLTRLELCNFWGINVFRYTKDSKAKKKSAVMACITGLIVLILIAYVCVMCLGLNILGAAEIIPAYLIAVASIITLMFSIFKAGGIIFRKQGYEIMTALPLSKWAVVVSRFFKLYVENLAVILLVMLPGMIMYGIFVRPSITFYLIGIITIFVVPLFPVAISAGIGALITGIASRTKHKSLVEAGISVLLVVGVLFCTSKLPQSEDEITMEILQNIMNIVTATIGNIYPPAIWLGKAMVQGRVLYLGVVWVAFLMVFAIVVTIVALNFHKICKKLYVTSAKHNYQLEHLQKNKVLKALVIREARRYFASGIYVSNTIIGPIMGTVLCIVLLFVDLESVTSALPVALNVKAAIPFGVGAIFVMMNTASISISMEGKEVWILKSLPLSRKAILDSKILFNVCLYMPFYIVSVIMMIIALKPSVWEMIGMIFIPVIIIVFASVFGITMNLLLPKLTWESEVEVVKQSASAMIGGIGGTLVALVCAGAVLIVQTAYTHLVSVGMCIVLVGVAGIMYYRNRCKE